MLHGLPVDDCDKEDEENDTADAEGEFGGKGTFVGSILATTLVELLGFEGSIPGEYEWEY
jgi:hypothetical protein